MRILQVREPGDLLARASQESTAQRSSMSPFKCAGPAGKPLGITRSVTCWLTLQG
jgi:hypothetical protein